MVHSGANFNIIMVNDKAMILCNDWGDTGRIGLNLNLRLEISLLPFWCIKPII